MKRLIIYTALALTLNGCMHKMSDHEIASVTTCENTSQRTLVKNLLLSGYTIAEESEEYVVTDYKQLRGTRTWQRVTLVETDDDNWSFRIRRRQEYTSQVPVATTAVTTTKRSRRNRNKAQRTTEQSQVYETITQVEEYDQNYYKELKSDYIGFQKTVCRNDSIANI
jgi:hypothetical protein